MKRILVALAGLLLAPFALSAAPAHSATAARNYDCSKSGNANKAMCKTAAAPVAPAGTKTTRSYDCSKAGNANKAVCKGAVTTAPAAPSTTYAPRPKPAAPSVAAPPRAPVSSQNANPSRPNGATAKCRDGAVSFSAHRAALARDMAVLPNGIDDALIKARLKRPSKQFGAFARGCSFFAGCMHALRTATARWS